MVISFTNLLFSVLPNSGDSPGTKEQIIVKLYFPGDSIVPSVLLRGHQRARRLKPDPVSGSRVTGLSHSGSM